MKILAIADEPSKYLWDFYKKGRLDDIDLIISAGDLPSEYLSFLVTFAKCPLLYVTGNHDTKYIKDPPEGCICIDDKVYVHEGVRIFGLGGSMKYKKYAEFQYTEGEMRGRLLKASPRLIAKGVDIFVTHTPARGLGDMDDLPHRGFECFNGLLNKYSPQLHCYGHVHREYGRIDRRITHPSGTLLINCSGHVLHACRSFSYREPARARSCIFRSHQDKQTAV